MLCTQSKWFSSFEVLKKNVSSNSVVITSKHVQCIMSSFCSGVLVGMEQSNWLIAFELLEITQWADQKRLLSIHNWVPPCCVDLCINTNPLIQYTWYQYMISNFVVRYLLADPKSHLMILQICIHPLRRISYMLLVSDFPKVLYH